MERIVQDLKLLDQPPRHVMFEARIVVLERSDLLNMGVQWTWPRVEAGLFSTSDYHGGGMAGPDWPCGVQIGYTTGKEFTNSLVMTLNLLAQNQEATVIANPQVMAQDGKEAEIKVATEEYFKIVTEGYYTRTDLEKIETGTILKITPRIGESGDITLEITTEVSDVVARGEDNLPVVTRRTTKNTVRIQDGGTAVLAGLMDSRSGKEESWVPGIGKLPLVGGLFRNDASLKRSRQVSVFITASLMGEPEPRLDNALTRRPVISRIGEEEFKKALKESLRRLEGERKQ
jgi:type II secretory pathway component GspD/PulD (secretin)